MKIIPEQYQCEVCGSRYSTKEETTLCELRKAPIYPIGLIYGNHSRDAFYKDITFAVAENKIHEHYNNGGFWACRDNGYGDSLDEELCCGGSLFLGEYDGKIDVNHATFKRMVEYLKRKNIKITVWDGSKAISLEEACLTV
jgi:hypothetical protein